jgi:hypothetical protein
MKSKLKFAVGAVALLTFSHLAIAEDAAPALAPPAAAEAPAAAPSDAQAKGDADMKAAMQGEMERQLYVSMVALKDYCKTTDAEHAKGYDESWDKNTADAPAELKALSSTPDFVAKVAARLKELAEGAKVTEAAAKLKDACGKILATN